MKYLKGWKEKKIKNIYVKIKMWINIKRKNRKSRKMRAMASFDVALGDGPLVNIHIWEIHDMLRVKKTK